MKKTLTDWLNARNNFGIFYPPMKAEEFVEFIKEYLLNENCSRFSKTSNRLRRRRENLFRFSKMV